MCETLHSEQKIERFEFLILQGCQDKNGSRMQREKRSSFIMYVKESLSVTSSMF